MSEREKWRDAEEWEARLRKSLEDHSPTRHTPERAHEIRDETNRAAGDDASVRPSTESSTTNPKLSKSEVWALARALQAFRLVRALDGSMKEHFDERVRD